MVKLKLSWSVISWDFNDLVSFLGFGYLHRPLISTGESSTHSDTLLEKTRPCLVMSPYLIKAMRNFMFLTMLSIRNMSQHKGQFTHLFVTNLPFIFMWVQLLKNQLKIWKKLWPLTIDHSRDNKDYISFFIFSYLQWNMITTRFTSTGLLLASLKGFGLLRRLSLTLGQTKVIYFLWVCSKWTLTKKILNFSKPP